MFLLAYLYQTQSAILFSLYCNICLVVMQTCYVQTVNSLYKDSIRHHSRLNNSDTQAFQENLGMLVYLNLSEMDQSDEIAIKSGILGIY